MITKVLIALAVLVALVLILAAFQPSEFSVARSTKISAPPSVIFAQTNDLHRYQVWNPWGKLDPAARYTHEGPPAGVGASLAWAGNAKVGEGRMTIIESHPSDFIKMRLDFQKPFASTCEAQFTFKPEGDQTVVTWSMSGQSNFVSKVMCLFMSMDKMVGGEFENGLASLKSLSETAARK